MSYNHFNKNIVIARSKYEQVNNFVLNAYLNSLIFIQWFLDGDHL